MTTALPVATVGERTQLEWLDKSPCAAPCWEGITPGQTTAEEALQILSKQPYFEHVQFDYGHSVSWHWSGEEWASEAKYDPNSPSRFISVINASFTYSFALADVRIQAYGEPSHVLAHTYHNSGNTFYVLRYVYLSQGILLVYPSRGEFKPPLQASTRFRTVTFFAPSEDGLIATTAGSTDIVKLLRPWEGFLDYDHYCVDYPAFTTPCG